MARKLCFALHTALLVFTFFQLAASEVVDHKKTAPLQKRADCRFETAEDDTLTTYGEQVRISPEIACRGSDCQLTRSMTYTLPNTNTFGIPSDTDVDLFDIVSADISFRSVNAGTVGHTVQETLSQKVLAGTMGFVSLKPKYECTPDGKFVGDCDSSLPQDKEGRVCFPAFIGRIVDGPRTFVQIT